MLVGNKSDLRHLRAVPTEEARSYAGKIENVQGCLYAPVLACLYHIGYRNSTNLPQCTEIMRVRLLGVEIE